MGQVGGHHAPVAPHSYRPPRVGSDDPFYPDHHLVPEGLRIVQVLTGHDGVPPGIPQGPEALHGHVLRLAGVVFVDQRFDGHLEAQALG